MLTTGSQLTTPNRAVEAANGVTSAYRRFGDASTANAAHAEHVSARREAAGRAATSMKSEESVEPGARQNFAPIVVDVEQVVVR